MSDQNIPAGLTRDEARAVREWAERARDARVQDETVAHAARVLLAVLPTPPTTTAKENPELPDQTLDDQVRPIVAAMRAAMRRDEHAYPEAKFLADLSGYIKDLEALLPQRPTLADMTDKERDECLRMQADVKGVSIRAVIVSPHWEVGIARVMSPGGFIDEVEWREITPRPDLPRMEWPGTEKPAPAAPALPEGWLLADHQKRGRVIVTRPQPDNDGAVVIICPDPDRMTLADTVWCMRDKLTFLDTDQEVDQ